MTRRRRRPRPTTITLNEVQTYAAVEPLAKQKHSLVHFDWNGKRYAKPKKNTGGDRDSLEIEAPAPEVLAAEAPSGFATHVSSGGSYDFMDNS